MKTMSTRKIISAREFGVPFEGKPGRWNAITDVWGVQVGYSTIISGSGKLRRGKGPVRTGVTAILPRGKIFDPVFAARDTLNGNGEMTGSAWIEESGFLESPILITNTHSVGVVRDAAIVWMIDHNYYRPISKDIFWLLPVVTETYDGYLNDINGFHVKKEHVFSALNNAAWGPIELGNVGGGTGMICHGFKGGTGTSSRTLSNADGGYTLGVLVQANHGMRKNLTIAGVPIYEMLPPALANKNIYNLENGTGSIIVVVATDAPLLPHQLKRLVKRVPMGIGRVGGVGENSSGDLFIAFSTANRNTFGRTGAQKLAMLSNDLMTPLFEAVIQATEEAIVNALFLAETIDGIDRRVVEKLPIKETISILRKYNKIVD
ncbi:MAG: P1 family peptidase [Bacteroidota bacterium]